MRHSALTWLCAASLAACSASTSKPDQPTPATEVAKPPTARAFSSRPNLGLPPLPIPADNPQSPGKIALGQQLFEEKRFSADGTVSCSNCHAPEKAFTDRLPKAQGIAQQTGTRNSPTVINAAYYSTQFWDGRRPSLEEQAKDPFTNPIEHGLPDHSKIVRLVRSDADYRRQFAQVFKIDPATTTLDHVVKAIASFERTVIAGDSPFDRYQYGNQPDAMTAAAVRGLALFRGQARCVSCHTIEQTSATFTDNRFHNLGVGFHQLGADPAAAVHRFNAARHSDSSIDVAVLTQAQASELGRFAVTEQSSDLGAFKTSTLRNIALTAPYMHDGSLPSLESVVDFYNRGGNDNPALDGGIRPLGLSAAEQADLVEFLKSLTSDRFASLSTPPQRSTP